MEDHGRQLSKTISDVASKLSGAKAGGMFKSMMSSTSASFSGSNIASAFANNLSPRRSSIQDGTVIDGGAPADAAIEAALLEASYEDDENLVSDMKAASLKDNNVEESSRS